MYKPGSSSEGLGKATKSSQAAERDEIQRRLGSVLILRQQEGHVRSPVITLSTEKTSIYNVVEKHLKPEAVVGTDRWWRLCRGLHQPPLEAWRPRVNGTQLKALQGVRLPETEAEWEAVREALDSLAVWLKDESSPESFLAELKQLAAHAQDWWENRTKREGSSGPGKRSAGSGAQLPNKRQHLSVEGDGVGHAALGGDLSANQSLLQELAVAAMPASSAFPRMGGKVVPSGTASCVALGPNGEPLHGYMDMITAEQAAQAGMPQANGMAAQPPNGPIGDPSTSQQVPRLGPRFSAITVSNGEVQPTEVVPLNVGGRLLITELATLTVVPDSLLAQLVAAWVAFPSHSIFLDRDSQAFEDLLGQLRRLKTGQPASELPTDVARLQALKQEAQYFGIQDVVAACEAAPQAAAGPIAWQYDTVAVEASFPLAQDSDLAQLLQRAMREAESRAAEGWEVLSGGPGSTAYADAEGAEVRTFFYHLLLRKRR